MEVPPGKSVLRQSPRPVAHRMFAAVLATGLAAILSAQRELRVIERRPTPPITKRLALTVSTEKVEDAWAQKKWETVVAVAEEMIKADERDHRGYALKYVALLELKKKRQEALQYAVRVVPTLAKHPLELVGFIERALYAAPERNEFQIALMALVPLLPTAKRVARIRIAHLRALDGCSTAKEAAAMSRTVVEDIGDDKAGLFEVVRVICDMKNAKAMGPTAMHAMDRILFRRQGSRAELMIKYRILHDLLGDKHAARKLGAKILNKVGAENLNPWMWNLMVMPETAGKYPDLALQGAKLMEMTSDRPNFEYDTMALAFFRHDQIVKAIRYQRRALANASRGNKAEFEVRLRMYLAAASPEDKKAAEATGETPDVGEFLNGEKHGLWKNFHDNGSPKTEGAYENGQRTGEWKFWLRTGSLERRSNYVRDKLEGKSTVWLWDPETEKVAKSREDNLVGGHLQGICLTLHPNGKVKYKTTYERGRRHGAFEYRDRQGRLISKGQHDRGYFGGQWQIFSRDSKGKHYKSSEGNYSYSEREGKWRRYHADGTLRAEGAYNRGKRTGSWTAYFPNGKVKSVGEFENDEWTGRWRIWAEQGWLESEGPMLAGKKVGTWTYWQKNPKTGKHLRHSTGDYEKDYRSGTWSYFDSGGKLERRGPYQLGQKSGDWELYFSNGKVKSRAPYRDGVRHGESTMFYESGQRKLLSSYTKGAQTGKFERWHLNGKRQQVGTFANLKRAGKWTSYHANGQPSLEENYKDGILFGTAKRFHPNGARASEGEFVHGMRSGTWAYWHENGNVRTMGRWRAGVRTGSWTEHHANGVKAAQGSFGHGQRNGEWTFWDEDGNKDEAKSGHYRDGALVKRGDA